MKKLGFLKRTQAVVLVLAIMVSMMVPVMSVNAVTEPNATEGMSDGKIVAQNYELSNAEKELLASGLLAGKTHSYYVPDSDDGLVAVDTDNKKITVENYEGTNGYVWKPVSVNIVVGNDVKETVAIANNQGTYTFDGNAFSVVVDYALDINIAENSQSILLNTPKFLTEGLADLKTVDNTKSDLAIVEQAMPEMVLLSTTGKNVYVEMYQTNITVYFNTAAAKTATLALNEQMTKNGGKLDLTVMLEEYASAPSKVEYLIKNGAALKAKAAETQKHLDNILTAGFWSFIDDLDASEYSILYLLRSAVRGCSEDLKAVCEKSWDAIEKTVVKEGLTSLEYSVLDTLVAQVTTLTDVSAIEIKNPLRVSTAKVQYNMSMFDVKVKVVLNLVDTTSTDVKYYEYDSKTTTVTLGEGVSKDEILAAISATDIENSAKVSWGSAFVDGKFTATKSELPSELNKDIEYVVTYTPNMYDVTFAYGSLGTVSYPYGYFVNLEIHENVEKAYDYTVNGTYYAQGTNYKITDTTNISRSEGKSYISSNLYQIVADNYLEGKGANILLSGALLENKLVDVRYPDNSNNIVTLVGNRLTVSNYDASYNNFSWKPYSYTLSNGNTYLFNGNNQVEIQEDFETVTVNYRLYLENFDTQTVIGIANIPAILVEEANKQLSALNRISNQKANFEILNRTVVNILEGLIENSTLSDDATKDAMLKARFKADLDLIQSECMGSVNLHLFDIVSEYKDSTDGLLYYYNNNEYIRNEVGKLADFMKDMLEADEHLSAQEKLDALEKLIRSLPSDVVPSDKAGEYVNKLTTLETTMNEVKNELLAPNALIDLNSSRLAALTDAIQSEGQTNKFTSLDEALYITDSSIVVFASDKVAVTVNLQIEGGKNTTVTSNVVFVDLVIDQDFVDALKNNIKQQLVAQSIDSKYYDTTYDETVFDALVGVVAGDIQKQSYDFVWTYKTFEVLVPDADTQYVSYADRVISLPASTDSAYRFDYYINGVKVNGTSYTLSVADLDKVIAGEFNVTKKSVLVLRESLVNYVNSLNNSIGNDQAVFALVENENGEFSIVLKIDAGAPKALTSAVQDVAIAVVQGAYPYIGLDNQHFLKDGSVYLQSIVDALLNSGFSADTLFGVVDENGNIINMSVEGDVLTNKPLTAMGGKLLETTMQLGTSANDITSVPFYVTLGAVPEEFIDVKNLYEEKLGKFITFACEDGKIGISLNVPQKMYEAFLAVLLITENISLNDVNAVNGEIAVTFINNLFMPLLKGDITVETFDNTLAKLGLNLDLSSKQGAEELFSTIKSFYTGATFTYDETSGTASGNIGISSFIDSMNVGVLGNIIAEKDTGLDIALSIGLDNLGVDYEAIYVDVSAAGVTNKVGLTADLSEKLGEIAGTSVIVLLKDIEDDLIINKPTLLNLNGFSIKGDLTANRKTLVIDSNIEYGKNAGVTGKVSGNVTLVAGKYQQDVSEFVKLGFVQNSDGVVTNQYYDIAKDAEGNVVVSLNAGFINTNSMPDVVGLAVDIACDLLFNGYTSNYLELDGKTIYNITLEDLIGLYSSSNRVDSIINEALKVIDTPQLSAFVNKVIDDVTDLTAISEAIRKDAPVLEYSMVTKPWNVEFTHVVDGDYITASVVSGKKTNSTNLKICVVGEQADKLELADLFEELGKTITTDINIEVSHNKVGNDIKVSASAGASVIVDWTNPDYAVMFSVIIADGLNGTTRENLVNGIRAYYETGNLGQLDTAFNSLKIRDVLTALKALGINDSFSNMVKALGLDDVVDTDVVELEELYDKIGKAVAFAVRKVDITGPERTIGSLRNSDGSYGISRENIEKMLSKNLFRGYSLDVDVSVEKAEFKLKLFDEEGIFPEFVDKNGTPEVLASDKIAGSKVNYNNMTITIDGHISGITIGEFKQLLKLKANNADSIEIVIGDGTLSDSDLIVNGAKLTATAKRKGVKEVDVVSYTIIILGDINCNGRIEVGDAVLISRALVGEYELNEIQALASDTNCNGRTDIGDATRIANKIVDWDNYESMLVDNNSIK